MKDTPGWKARLAAPLATLAIMWLLEVVDFILPGDPLDAFGIRPRSLTGLTGILFAPFLHVGFAHLIANSIPFLMLGLLVAARGVSEFRTVFIGSMLIGGFGTWLFGAPNSVHLGASGVIFGFFGFLVSRAMFERSLAALFFSILAAVLYGGMLWSLLPLVRGVSWSGHLFGFLGGMVTARVMSMRTARVPVS